MSLANEAAIQSPDVAMELTDEEVADDDALAEEEEGEQAVAAETEKAPSVKPVPVQLQVVQSPDVNATVTQQPTGTILISIQTTPSCPMHAPAPPPSASEPSCGEPMACWSDPRLCYAPPNVTVAAEFIYFKAIEDSLRFGDKIPLAGFTPTTHGVEPTWSYDPGARVELAASLGENWAVAGIWTWFRAHPPSASAADSSSSVWSSLDQPAFNNSTGNQFLQYISANWNLRMNVWDLEFRKPFCIGKIIQLSPILGVQGCLIKQQFHVQYGAFLLSDSISQTPQSVRCKARTWGVGPEIGLEGRLLAVQRMDLFFRTAISSMAGQFKVKTVYGDLLYSPSTTTITMDNVYGRMFTQIQLQAAASKRWSFGCRSSVEIMLGWETQVWFRQNRWEFFSTLARPPEGGDLTLYGPFARLTCDF